MNVRKAEIRDRRERERRWWCVHVAAEEEEKSLCVFRETDWRDRLSFRFFSGDFFCVLFGFGEIIFFFFWPRQLT